MTHTPLITSSSVSSGDPYILPNAHQGVLVDFQGDRHTIEAFTEEGHRTTLKEGVWLVIDGIGVCRNTAGIYGNASLISAHGMTAAMAPAAQMVNAVITPCLLVAGGLLTVGSAVAHTIPDALKERRAAYEEKQRLESSAHLENGWCPGEAIDSPQPTPAEKTHAAEGVLVANLGVANQCLFAAMGAATTGCGVTSGLPEISALLGSHLTVSPLATPAASIALGSICAVRGGLLVGRAAYQLQALNTFQEEFSSKCQNQLLIEEPSIDALDAVINWVEEQRWHTNATGHCEENLWFARRMGLPLPDKLSEDASIQDKVAYIAAVDKAIFAKKVQQWLNIIIGLAMLIGGIVTVVIAVLALTALATNPLALLLCVGVSSMFLLMEWSFLSYDCSYLFKKLVHQLYKEPSYLHSPPCTSDEMIPPTLILTSAAPATPFETPLPTSPRDTQNLHVRFNDEQLTVVQKYEIAHRPRVRMRDQRKEKQKRATLPSAPQNSHSSPINKPTPEQIKAIIGSLDDLMMPQEGQCTQDILSIELWAEPGFKLIERPLGPQIPLIAHCLAEKWFVEKGDVEIPTTDWVASMLRNRTIQQALHYEVVQRLYPEGKPVGTHLQIGFIRPTT